MFTNLVDDKWKKEIEELAKDHADALLVWGGAMHRDGMIKGAVWFAAGLSILGVAYVVGKIHEKHVKSKKEES